MKNLVRKITPNFLINLYHYLLALTGALFYGFPSKKIKVIGITGTNGKTTVTEMVARILEEAGYKVALMNSIRFKIIC
jgi:UDP-N-acetylmuramoyl-L-alanyl-D-glutamate--2,6-diaminopimelate ligase